MRKNSVNQVTGKRRCTDTDEYDCDGHAIGTKKINAVCPTCGFSAKIAWNTSIHTNTNTLQTFSCPVHQIPLISLGFRYKVPKKGTKKFQKMLALAKHRLSLQQN